MTEHKGIDTLQQSVVESFMGVCSAPDDPTVARRADEALHALDAALSANPALPLSIGDK